MAVAVDHRAKPCGFRFQIESAEIMQHVDRHTAGFNDFGFRQSTRPRFGIDVAADRGYRRDLRERFENFGSADVAGVEDALGSAESFDCFTAQ